MCRCLGKVWAGVLILAVAGCTLDSFLLPGSVVYGPKLIVAGTVGEVSATLQDGLSDAGIIVVSKRVGDDFRIAGKVPKTSTAFCLHLSEKKIGGSVKTLLRMQWDRGGDDELWQRIQAILTTPTDDGGRASKAPTPANK